MLGGIMVVTETDLVDFKKNKKPNLNEKGAVPTQKAANGLTRTIKAVNEWEANDSKSNWDIKDESDWDCWTMATIKYSECIRHGSDDIDIDVTNWLEEDIEEEEDCYSDAYAAWLEDLQDMLNDMFITDDDDDSDEDENCDV